MRLLHTSDWHLGQRFIQAERQQEQQFFLDWLKQTLIDEAIDVLIVAGDIFDIGAPPNYALHQYYRFLSEIQQTPCRHVVVIGGNHDSPATLNAPKDLLNCLDVHVVGCCEYDDNQLQVNKEIIELKDAHGQLQAVVAAVPFLRERDLKYAQSGETASQREEKIRAGIKQHYQLMAEALVPYQQQAVPLLATGHLYMAGSCDSESEKDIYLGNLGKISASHLPDLFDYVALGHLHRAQKVAQQSHIRYCGAPLALGFDEAQQQKIVLVCDFAHNQLQQVTEIKVPQKRQLLRFKGDLSAIKQQIKTCELTDNLLTPWADILLKTEQLLPMVHEQLHALATEREIEILKIQIERPAIQAMTYTEQNLAELSAMDVFEQRCQQQNKSAEEIKQLKETFVILQDLLADTEI